MIHYEDLIAFHARARVGYDVLQHLPQKLRRTSTYDFRAVECNSEEKRIAELFDEALYKIAHAIDELRNYTWRTYVTEHQARLAEDAIYLAQEESRKEFGETLDVLCVERLPTEYDSKILWRVTMWLPKKVVEEDDEG